MAIVIDASVTLSVLLPDEKTAKADPIIEEMKSSGAIVPTIWWFEVRNGLIMAERRKRLKLRDVKLLLAALNSLPFELDRAPHEDTLISLADKYKLSIYDAAYLELAVRLKQPLATFDDALMKAARKERVVLYS